jgi:hypothetical protein
VIYQRALNGDTIAAIFYLKAQRPKYRDRLSIDIEQVQSEIKEALECIRANPALLGTKPVLQIAE